MALAEIALSCGFETPSHFYRVFKRRYGMTPHALRASGL
jgi:AraC-like DNA-binding protein